MTLADLKADFQLLTAWEDRYRHLIELGQALPELSADEKNATTKVNGCTSQVWLVVDQTEPFQFRAQSDAMIVNGLIAVLRLIYQDQPQATVASLNPAEIFAELGLDKHLSPNRRSGLVAMVNRIQQAAGT